MLSFSLLISNPNFYDPRLKLPKDPSPTPLSSFLTSFFLFFPSRHPLQLITTLFSCLLF